MWSGRVDI
ncbi:hypothetical protein F383_19212 [Gossypium arboreum]|uniref:Uncharacterized protein n=1 Tax=Gossypium arboreum TaxID=29729 RepID=A0A0B0MG47_GOSAR|nr:hypothetical protein F383_19212 [Gossypium arboreum]